MVKEQLYRKYAKYYDKIHDKFDQEQESAFIKWAVDKHKMSEGNYLLDVACGTGRHVEFLKEYYEILGVDINPEMLKIARLKNPEVKFINGDMKKLDIGGRFDVIICMFSAVNYNTTLGELKITLTNFYNHLKNGGILIFDLGLNLDNWIEGLVSVDTIVDEKLKIAVLCQSHLDNGVFNADFVYLIKENGKFDFDIDQHELGVFGMENVVELMEDVGFENFIYAEFTSEAWDARSGDRPIFVGVK